VVSVESPRKSSGSPWVRSRASARAGRPPIRVKAGKRRAKMKTVSCCVCLEILPRDSTTAKVIHPSFNSYANIAACSECFQKLQKREVEVPIAIPLASVVV
jgi:hypothetical protein